jgi:D-alanyl-D-alanine endopeptidase (penicillin-binding protein 7)
LGKWGLGALALAGWLTLGGVMAVSTATAAEAAESAKPAKPESSKAVKPAARSAVRPVAKPGHSTRAVKSPHVSRQVAAARKPVVKVEPASASFGHLHGLQNAGDALALKSSVALVVDQDTDEVLFSKNPEAVLPIASITKLMTALVVTEAALPLEETLTVAQDDVDATAGSRSRLKVGTQLTRGEMLHLALMSSENRAAHVLGRTYPGGLQPFVEAMNEKAQSLGMADTRYVEPTGLSSNNQSSAQDLTRLVRAAFLHPILRELSTSPEASVPLGSRQVQFHNTNGLVRNPQWEIGLQKTGYISAAGRCLVMQAQLAGRKLIMVLLDSAGKYSRIGDAERIRKWLAANPIIPSAMAAPAQPR